MISIHYIKIIILNCHVINDIHIRYLICIKKIAFKRPQQISFAEKGILLPVLSQIRRGL